MRVSQRFLKQGLYGENSIPLKESSAEIRLQNKQKRMSKKQKELNDEAGEEA